MANISVSSFNTLATMVAANALGGLRANTVLARIINRDYDNAVATAGQSVQIPIRGALSVNTKAANSNVTLQNPSDSSVTVTLNQHKEVSFLIEDPARAMASYDALSGYTSDAVVALSEYIDAQIAGLYTGFSQTIDASGGLTEAHFRKAQKFLNVAKARGQLWAVMSEDGFYEAQGIEKLVNRDYRGMSDIPALANGNSMGLGMFAGFDIVLDQKIATVAGTPSTRKNLFLHRDAAVLVTRPLPVAPQGTGVTQVVMDEDGIGLRVTMSYNPSALGVQVTVDVLFGLAEMRDDHAVVVSTAVQS